ncbi:MAG: hypothetical protein JW999_02100 [Methanotrichaceae archaeon]|nr:hypothetical protein [Methanotrichaceae archaeon]
MLCQHVPQSCDESSSFPWTLFAVGNDIGTTDKANISRQNNQEPSILRDTINTSANCNDNNPCTRDSYGADGCVHDPVNCDDGNASTADICGPSGCVNLPLLGDSSNFNVKMQESLMQESLSSVIPEIQNETAGENTTNNESQSGKEMAKALPICDDGNLCTRDTHNETGCVFELLNCDDGNESTLDSCKDGICINVPIDSGSIFSENNTTALSASEALMASQPHSCDDHDPCTLDTLNGTECEHELKICDDGDASTFDYCYGGECYNTTTSCDDGDPCTIDSYNGTACVSMSRNCDDGNTCTYDRCDRKTGCYNPWKCNDGNPCTVDHCDPVGGCLHLPVVCRDGKTCINGVCQYPYYTHAALYYPYAAPSSRLPPANSYTIPAGTTITLPWSQSVVALNALKVENGMTYPGASPQRFMRLLGFENQAISANQKGQSISEQAEMIGISWKDAHFNLTVIQPNGSVLPVQGDNQNVVHLVGSNYDYYFLRSAARGNWIIEIQPINPSSNGVGFSLITGLVKGAIPNSLP